MSASTPPSRPAVAGARGRILTVAGGLVSIVAIAAVVVWALHQQPPRLPTSAGALSALGGAVGLYLAACAVRGERWLALLRHNGAEPQRADAYGLVAVGYLGNNVLPARAGDALRVVLLTPRARTDARTVIGTLVAERVLDVVVLVGLFVVLAYGVLSGVDVPSGGRLAFAGVLGAVVLVAAAGAAWVAHRSGHLRRMVAFLAPMAAATRRLRRRHGAAMLGLTAALWALEGGVWWATAEAAGLHLSALEAAYLLAVASLFVLVPAGPGYVGTLDAAVVFGVRALGRAPSAALSYLLLLRFVLIVPITLVGLAVLVGRYGGVGRLRAAVA